MLLWLDAHLSVFSLLQIQKTPGRLPIQGMFSSFCAWSITVIPRTPYGTVLTFWKLWLWLLSILDHPRYVHLRPSDLRWVASRKKRFKGYELKCIAVCFHREGLKAFWLPMVQLLLKGKAMLIPPPSRLYHTLPRNKCGILCESSWWTVFSASQQTNNGIRLSCFLRSLVIIRFCCSALHWGWMGRRYPASGPVKKVLTVMKRCIQSAFSTV